MIYSTFAICSPDSLSVTTVSIVLAADFQHAQYLRSILGQHLQHVWLLMETAVGSIRDSLGFSLYYQVYYVSMTLCKVHSGRVRYFTPTPMNLQRQCFFILHSYFCSLLRQSFATLWRALWSWLLLLIITLQFQLQNRHFSVILQVRQCTLFLLLMIVVGT